MNSPQTKVDNPAKAEDAFLNVEGEIRDLQQMASITWGLLMKVKATPSGTGAQLNILPWEFEQIQFAVCHTMSLASDLEKAFKKGVRGGGEHMSAAAKRTVRLCRVLVRLWIARLLIWIVKTLRL